MATSDNVVRAGLTSKYQDAATLLEMLSFKSETPEALSPRHFNGIDWYPRRCDDFQMGLVRAVRGAERVRLQVDAVPVMVLALHGAVTVRHGSSLVRLDEGIAALDLSAGTETEIILESPEALAVVAK
jgi:mannose-6-phosphate isomerase